MSLLDTNSDALSSAPNTSSFVADSSELKCIKKQVQKDLEYLYSNGGCYTLEGPYHWTPLDSTGLQP
jgi:hypothetical protein